VANRRAIPTPRTFVKTATARRPHRGTMCRERSRTAMLLTPANSVMMVELPEANPAVTANRRWPAVTATSLPVGPPEIRRIVRQYRRHRHHRACRHHHRHRGCHRRRHHRRRRHHHLHRRHRRPVWVVWAWEPAAVVPVAEELAAAAPVAEELVVAVPEAAAWPVCSPLAQLLSQ
jgi:hypothetical protein